MNPKTNDLMRPMKGSSSLKNWRAPSKNSLALRNPPTWPVKMPVPIPTTQETTYSTGNMTTPASTRGRMRNPTELSPITSSASICSDTRIVPSSAAMRAPTRPARMKPAITTPSSSMMDGATMEPMIDFGMKGLSS